MRKVRALVHMHNYSITNDGDHGDSFRQEINMTLSKLSTFLNSARFKPVDLREQIVSAFSKLKEYQKLYTRDRVIRS